MLSEQENEWQMSTGQLYDVRTALEHVTFTRVTPKMAAITIIVAAVIIIVALFSFFFLCVSLFD